MVNLNRLIIANSQASKGCKFVYYDFSKLLQTYIIQYIRGERKAKSAIQATRVYSPGVARQSSLTAVWRPNRQKLRVTNGPPD